jgi:phytoene desaturase
MEKMIIIGAGVAGLSAGIYARLNGLDAEIYELHTIAGGECTAWKRGEYLFDNCIHWLMGSKPGTPLNRIWREVGALDDSVEIINNGVFTSVEMEGRTAVVYRSIDRFEKHLLELSPQDVRLIRSLCRDCRKFKRLGMPVEKPMDMISPLQGLKLGLRMLPLMGLMAKYGKITLPEYAAKFTDPLLRALLERMMPAPYSAMPLLMTLGSLDNMDSGFPRGGSLPFAQRMEKRFLALGGRIFYKSRVEKIIVEGCKAVGVRLSDGSERRADWVISAADGYSTLYGMLGGKFVSEKMREMYEDSAKYPVYSTVQVSVGIAADLSDRPGMLAVKVDEPVDAGGITHDFVPMKNYCFDKTMVPPGKSVVTSLLDAGFDWWKAKKEDPKAYKAEKERIAREVCAAIEARYPEAKGKIEQVDVATPMTYARYCNAWRGSWMSFMTTPKNGGMMSYMPGNLPGLDRFYMAGQWTMPPGGLPGAVLTGRWAIQRICANNKREFKVK